MKTQQIPTEYYQQFDADYSLQYPGEGYGGWQKKSLPINLEKTAIILMHIWDPLKIETYPGSYRAVEYLNRAQSIINNQLPQLLTLCRNNHIKIYHMADEQKTPITKLPIPTKDTVFKQLSSFKNNNVFPGKHNIDDIIKKGRSPLLINALEPIVYNGEQLHKQCLEDGINHLIYVGFAINWCLQFSPGNMNEMSSRGFICSTIKECITAVENKESAKIQGHKEYGLWITALKNGFVYTLADWVDMLETK
ncbi:MAG: hypothetical protein KAG94_03390 [Clostridiales bacterium]|nr:hypothetical protein [Clostridiales bacterium]